MYLAVPVVYCYETFYKVKVQALLKACNFTKSPTFKHIFDTYEKLLFKKTISSML